MTMVMDMMHACACYGDGSEQSHEEFDPRLHRRLRDSLEEFFSSFFESSLDLQRCSMTQSHLTCSIMQHKRCEMPSFLAL